MPRGGGKFIQRGKVWRAVKSISYHLNTKQ